MVRISHRSALHRWEKITALVGVAFLVAMLVVSLAVPNPTETQWFVVRMALSVSAAGIGVVFPGLIFVNVGRYVRAGGAIALFVLVYCLNPPRVVTRSPSPIRIEQHTRGAQSPAVSGVQGDVSITGAAGSTSTPEKPAAGARCGGLVDICINQKDRLKSRDGFEGKRAEASTERGTAEGEKGGRVKGKGRGEPALDCALRSREAQEREAGTFLDL